MRGFKGRILCVLAGITAMTGMALAAPGATAAAPATPTNHVLKDQRAVKDDHTVNLVNHSGRTVWIGSQVNDDGSQALSGLPILEDGQSATITIPESAGPGWWRGKLFARTGCSGNSGSDFHCQVGDCGVDADRCSTGEQPASLAEFNFDTHDNLAPWYDVSYVNAFSLPVTIDPNDAPAPPPGSSSCGGAGCSDNLLPLCPGGAVQTGDDGKPINCVNPNRDAKTDYSDMLEEHCPKAYAWSKQDTEPGNQVMFQCSQCSGFTVTFNSVG